MKDEDNKPGREGTRVDNAGVGVEGGHGAAGWPMDQRGEAWSGGSLGTKKAEL